jgi:outer membrane protein assembly factor BamB
VPRPIGPRESRVSHVIASADAVFATGVAGDSPAVWRLDPHGKQQWVFDSRVDIHRGHWATWALGSVLLNDDGLYLLDLETGRNKFDRGLDSWGQSLSDGQRFFMVNTWHVAGPRLFVGAFDAEGKALWRKFERGQHVGDIMEDVGGLALDQGLVFYAADYKFQPSSLVAALDPDSGEVRWSKNTFPISALSVANGHLFHVETSGRARPRALVARSVTDGEVVWSAPVQGTPTMAPVIAHDTVIIDTDEGLDAYRMLDGRRVWRNQHGPVRNPFIPPCSTHLLAAMGSQTLLLVDDRRLRVLRLASGEQLWSGEVPGVLRMHSPVLVGTRLYVAAAGALVALDPQ